MTIGHLIHRLRIVVGPHFDWFSEKPQFQYLENWICQSMGNFTHCHNVGKWKSLVWKAREVGDDYNLSNFRGVSFLFEETHFFFLVFHFIFRSCIFLGLPLFQTPLLASIQSPPVPSPHCSIHFWNKTLHIFNQFANSTLSQRSSVCWSRNCLENPFIWFGQVRGLVSAKQKLIEAAFLFETGTVAMQLVSKGLQKQTGHCWATNLAYNSD